MRMYAATRRSEDVMHTEIFAAFMILLPLAIAAAHRMRTRPVVDKR
jgi:hypothetical protein